MLEGAENSSSADRVPLSALFIGFLKVSLCGFGGGLVWARRVVVEQRQWMDEQEFAETLTLCQLMPGPNIVGITVCVGAKLRGAIGAVSAVAGFILVPWTVGLTVGGLVLRYAEIAVLQNILGGLSAAAAGLLIGTGLRLLTAAPQSPHGVALCRFGFRWHGVHQAAAADRAAHHWLRSASPLQASKARERDEQLFRMPRIGGASGCTVVDQLWRVPDGSAGCS